LQQQFGGIGKGAVANLLLIDPKTLTIREYIRAERW
jgi:hypothetical protein